LLLQLRNRKVFVTTQRALARLMGTLKSLDPILILSKLALLSKDE
jgi:hypothetical protein